MATHSSILAWRIPWTEEPGGLESMGLQRVGYDWVTKHRTGFNSTWTETSIRKGRGTRDQISNIHWIIETAREFPKNIYFCFTVYAKSIDHVDHNKLWKILIKRWECQTISPACQETCMQVKNQPLELDMEQWTSSKLGKQYVKAIYCHPAYLTYMQSTSCEILNWMKHSWNQDCREKDQ